MYARLGQISPLFPYLKDLQAISPSYVTITKLSSNEIKQTSCKELK